MTLTALLTAVAVAGGTQTIQDAQPPVPKPKPPVEQRAPRAVTIVNGSCHPRADVVFTLAQMGEVPFVAGNVGNRGTLTPLRYVVEIFKHPEHGAFTIVSTDAATGQSCINVFGIAMRPARREGDPGQGDYLPTPPQPAAPAGRPGREA